MSWLKYGKSPLLEDPYDTKISISSSYTLSIDYTLKESHIKECVGTPKNASSAKEQFWRVFFGDTPMPTPKPGAAKRASGMLGRNINLTDEDIQIGIAQLDQ